MIKDIKKIKKRAEASPTHSLKGEEKKHLIAASFCNVKKENLNLIGAPSCYGWGSRLRPSPPPPQE